MSKEADRNLLEAVLSRNTHRVQLLLRDGADVNFADELGNTPLHYAVGVAFSEEVITYLLSAGADVHARNHCQHTPLFYGSSGRAVQALAAAGARFDVLDCMGRTPLHLLCEAACIEVLEALLLGGVSPDVADCAGRTVLHVCAEVGSEQTAELLLHSGATVDVRDREGRTPLHLAAMKGQKSFVGKCLQLVPECLSLTDRDGNTLLHLAMMHNHLALAELLIASGSDVRAKNLAGVSPGHIAALVGSVEGVSMLVRAGWMFSGSLAHEHVRALLHLLPRVVAHGSSGNIRRMLALGADVWKRDVRGETLLHLAVLYGRADNLACLLESGADVQQSDSFGNTALCVLTEEKKGEECARLLLKAGADIAHINHRGENVVDVLARRGEFEMCRCLVDAGALFSEKIISRMPPEHLSEPFLQFMLLNGASLQVTSAEGGNLLHMAAYRCGEADEWYPEWLIAHGVEVNVVDIHGCTPLHRAVHAGSTSLVKILLRHGANVSIRDKYGYTAAECCRHESVRQLLQEHGIDVPLRKNQAKAGLIFAFQKAVLSRNVMELRRCVAELPPCAPFESPDVSYMAIVCRYGNEECVQVLLGAGYAPELLRGTLLKTVLAAAVEAGNVKVLRMLALMLADDVLTGDDCRIVSDLLLKCKSREVLEAFLPLLKASGVSAAEFSALLSKATERGLAKMIQPLISGGAVVNESSAPYGATALHMAALGGHQEAVLELLMADASTDVVDVSGRTPLDYARLHSFAAVEELLSTSRENNVTKELVAPPLKDRHSTVAIPKKKAPSRPRHVVPTSIDVYSLPPNAPRVPMGAPVGPPQIPGKEGLSEQAMLAYAFPAARIVSFSGDSLEPVGTTDGKGVTHKNKESVRGLCFRPCSVTFLVGFILWMLLMVALMCCSILCS